MTESGVIHLGKTNLRLSALGIGAWQWGDRFFWGYGQSYTDADLQAAFAETLKAGINFIDTAELYGPWTSERKLGEFIRSSAARKKVVIATKFFPFPWRLRRGDLLRALRRSLQRLGLPQVDLYQTHWPSPPVPVETWMEAMADAVGDGLTRAVGVSNYSADQMRRSHDTLARRGIPLASNQVEYSLLHRLPERNGVLATCRELGVTPIAYSPIAKGILSGKYTPGRPPPGLRAMRYSREYLARAQPLIGLVKEIGEAHSKTPSQVALNWLICKGAVPIPGAKNVRQAQDNAGALGWRLDEAEVAALDKASDSVNSKQ
jgi:aryl-alcohol dehydrogenase-like predicted oxidoreductase